MTETLVRADLIRLGGNLTATFETEWSDGCVVRARTSTTYRDARIVRRNDKARRCAEHRGASGE